jgi:hypothetical protein
MAWLNFSVLQIAWHIIVIEQNAALEEPSKGQVAADD